jgi:hypothetical protein
MRGIKTDHEREDVTGDVLSQSRRAELEKLVAGVPNVKQVENELEVVTSFWFELGKSEHLMEPNVKAVPAKLIPQHGDGHLRLRLVLKLNSLALGGSDV